MCFKDMKVMPSLLGPYLVKKKAILLFSLLLQICRLSIENQGVNIDDTDTFRYIEKMFDISPISMLSKISSQP